MQIALRTTEIWAANWIFFRKEGLITLSNIVTPKLSTLILTSRDTYIERALTDMSITERKSLLKDKRTGRPICQIQFIKKIGDSNNENVFNNDDLNS